MAVDHGKESIKQHEHVSPFIIVLRNGAQQDINLFDYSLCIMQSQSESYDTTNPKILVEPRAKFDYQIGTLALDPLCC